MSLFNELKRRDVFRVGTAYVVVAWLLIQVAETVFPLFGFDDKPARIVVIVLAICFLPALISAWVFELTPDGLKKEKNIDRTHPITPKTGKKLDRMIIVVLVLALSFFAFDKFILSPGREVALPQHKVEEEAVARQEGEASQTAPRQVTAFDGGVAIGGDINAIAEPGGIAIATIGYVSITINQEQHESSLKHREQELRLELTTGHPENRAIIESELGAIINKLANIQESYEERIEFLQRQIVALDEIASEVPEKLLDEAAAALVQGDTSKASALFQKVEDRAGNLAAVAIFQNGRIAEDRIDYDVAYTKYLLATQLQPDNPVYAYYAGGMAKMLGLYDSAIEYYQAALRLLYESEELIDSFIVADIWDRLGSIWAIKGDYDKAIDYHEKALKIYGAGFGEARLLVAQDWTVNFGEVRTLVAGSWMLLGVAWRRKGDVNKALYYAEKAVKRLIAILGETHQKVSAAWDSLGSIWEDIGEYDHAIRYYEKSLKIDLIILDESHPNVAHERLNIGSAWAKKGEYDKAIGYYNQALKGFIAVFDESHPDVAVTWTDLGDAWQNKGDYNKAIGYYEQALEVWENRLGEDNPTTKMTRTALERAHEGL